MSEFPTSESVSREARGFCDLENAYDNLLNAALALSPVVRTTADDDWSDKVKALNLATDLVAYCLGKNDPFSLTTDDVLAAYAVATDTPETSL